ncbi:MAG: monovalent cation/H+ antiporter subunit D family protein [Myxococcales bacterium]|nr:monovalent cation/H+ antiporter subunit D family protein [Myxococcales bacterium]
MFQIDLLDRFPAPALAIFIPVFGALGIWAAGSLPLPRRLRQNIREGVTLVTALILFGVVLGIYLGVTQHGEDGGFLYWSAGASEHWTPTWSAEPIVLVEMLPGMPLSLKVEPLGMVYAMIASGLWILNSLYSIGYMRGNNEQHQTRFYVCFALAIGSVMGVAFSENVFSLFVFYEALSLTTYPLVAHKGTPHAVRSARVYLGLLVGTSIALFLLGIIGTWVYTGDLSFQPGGVFTKALAAGTLSAPVLGALFFLYMYGIGKAALMPMHRWLPAAMVAPTPVSALLHAVAVVKAGVFSVVKVVVYLFGASSLLGTAQGGWLVFVAGGTILIASCIALFQDNLKRRLAYSTVSQLSYITIAASLLNPLGFMAAAMHIAAHAFGKITLFFAAGSIYTAAHKTEISQLDGIGRVMPWTMGAFAIGTLSMIGVPPTAGFISKWFLLQGAWDAQNTGVIVVIILSTLLNAAYFLPIVYRAFFRPLPKDFHHHPHGEAPLAIVIALSGTALCTVLFFLYPNLFLNLALLIKEGLP